MTRYPIFVTPDAQRDLGLIWDYIADTDSATAADKVLDDLVLAAKGLSEYPERGSRPPELIAVGVTNFRQLHFKPYRLIYRVEEHRVAIYLIVDGRRDMQSLLQRRLLAD